ncbi:hypothetical protein TNIN_490231 [Trichonephila inaurata madagascariensis]|uniref:Uncharacterized protein n=1 Tax=Trichonephila inaurata madagascariensis TaxID=2747483 RepID=A0A8X6IK19_9ARAC|nr:hypothetical protein TNIN_490231 [Trichonephila inaurata madagascariensis]
MKLLDLGEDLWVLYVIGALPSDVTSLITRGEMMELLPHSRNASATIQINRRKIPGDVITSQKRHKWDMNLMIADQMKKRCSPECKEHYLNNWEELISPEMLPDKLKAFDNIRRTLPSEPRRHMKESEALNVGRQVSTKP